MKESIRQLTQEIVEQNNEVPIFRESTPTDTVNMIVEEANELKQEFEMAFLTDDLTQVAGEIADVLYLTLKLCSDLGLNADDLIRIKLIRNKLKYGGHHNQEQARKE